MCDPTIVTKARSNCIHGCLVENEFIKIKPDGNEGIPSAAKLAEELGLTSYRSATYAQVVKLSISD